MVLSLSEVGSCLSVKAEPGLCEKVVDGFFCILWCIDDDDVPLEFCEGQCVDVLLGIFAIDDSFHLFCAMAVQNYIKKREKMVFFEFFLLFLQLNSVIWREYVNE